MSSQVRLHREREDYFSSQTFSIFICLTDSGLMSPFAYLHSYNCLRLPLHLKIDLFHHPAFALLMFNIGGKLLMYRPYILYSLLHERSFKSMNFSPRTDMKWNGDEFMNSILYLMNVVSFV